MLRSSFAVLKGRAKIRVRMPRPMLSPTFGVLALTAMASGLVTLQLFGVAEGLTAVPPQSQTASLEEPITGQFRSLVFRAKRSQPFVADEREFDRELVCMALNIYFEARGEPAIGKLAVGHVVMNRVAARGFPQSVCEVVRQGGERRRHRCQFSWWCDGKSDQPRNAQAWEESLVLAKYILSGRSFDPTAGALWYHADYVSPHWKDAFDEGPTFGRHIFYSKKGLS